MRTLTEKIGLRPNNKQSSWLFGCLGAARFTYNWGLERWRQIYESGGKPSRNLLNRELNQLKKSELTWMYQYPWRAINAALEDLDRAFQHFFRRLKTSEKPGYPRFKSRKNPVQSFAIEGRAVRIKGKRVRLPKLGWVRMTHRPRLPGRIVSVRIKWEANRWWISLAIEVDDNWQYPHRCESQAAVGIDLGVKDLAVLSTGEKLPAPRFLRKAEARLRRLQKELSRRTKGGKNWWKTKRKITKLHFRIRCMRADYIHKFTASVVKRFRYIAVESLNIKGMMRGRLSKSVADASMSEVLRQLRYKAELAGCTIVEADQFFPSTKLCHVCGFKADLSLSDRSWVCPHCGTHHDRDVNAAVNLEKLAAAHAATACRPVSLEAAGQESSSCVNLG